jgi:hypothetical protein
MKLLLRSRFEIEIERALRRERLEFEVHPQIGGLQPDFLVTTPSGRRVVVEAKGWAMDDAVKARALRQVRRYAEATQADEVFLVVPKLAASWDLPNVVSPKALLARLTSDLQAGGAGEPKVKPRRLLFKRVAKARATVFAAMPFATEFDDVFLVSMAAAAKKNGVTCVRVDREAFEGDVVAHIKKQIDRCAAVIADLSGAKANVLFEVGYAHGRRKAIVPISSTPLSDLPFDVRNWNTLSYRQGQTHALIAPLARRLRKVLKAGAA